MAQYSLYKMIQRTGYRYFAIAVMFSLPTISFAQHLTLNDVLNRIERSNPALLAYQNRISAANELVKGAGAWMPPMASVEWDNVPYTLNNTSQLKFGIGQTFPNPKRIEAEKKYVSSISIAERNDAEFNKVALFAQAKENYYKLYISKLKISLLEENTKIIKLMISLAEKQMAISKGDMASIYRLRAKQVENETMIVHEQNAMRVYTVTLNYLMNENTEREFEIDTTNLMRNYRSLRTYSRLDSIEVWRNDILKINSQIATLKLNQSFIALRNRPEFGVRAAHYEQFGGMPNMFSVMGTMTIPSAPWSAKGYKSEVRSMDYSIAALEQDKQNLVNMTRQNIKMYSIELESEYKELDNYTQRVIPAYRKSLDASFISYGQNTNDMNMTLLVWDDLQTAQMEYLKHLDTYFKIQSEYEREMQIR